MTKKHTFMIVLALVVIAIVCFMFFRKKNTESSWAPIYRDPKKELIAMRGMANESNSVAGMINNPVIGAMKHKGTLG